MSFDPNPNDNTKSEDDTVRQRANKLALERNKPRAKPAKATASLLEPDHREIGKATLRFRLPTVRKGRGFTHYVRSITTIALELADRVARLEEELARVRNHNSDGGLQ